MQNFVTVKSIKSLCQCLKEKDDSTHLAAGCTDLIVKLRRERKYDDKFIDISKFKYIRKIEEDRNNIYIGSAVTMAEIEKSFIIRRWLPALCKAACLLGSCQIRNRATIGGNIANASQSADTLPVLFAFAAHAEIINSQGEIRRTPIEELVEGIGKIKLEADEAILNVVIPKSNSKSFFAKIGYRNNVTISKVNCCIKVDEGLAAVFLGAVGPKPVKAPLIENIIDMSPDSQIDRSTIHDAVYAQIEQLIPDRVSKTYKKSATEGLIYEILEEYLSEVRI